LEDLVEIIDPENTRWEAGKREVYKTIYRLKSEGHVMALRNGLFLIGSTENEKDAIGLIESYYWEIAQAFIRHEVRTEYVIAWPKALEMHIGDLSTPWVLIVYTKSTNKVLKISAKHKIVFKTIEAGKRITGNLFPKLLKYTIRRDLLSGGTVRILSLEAALLDALLVHAGWLHPDEYLVRKFLDRYASALDRGAFWKLVTMRYISSINRLRELAKEQGYDALYHDCISVIKAEGAGCFLTLKA
jgi:hypothetical protein